MNSPLAFAIAAWHGFVSCGSGTSGWVVGPVLDQMLRRHSPIAAALRRRDVDRVPLLVECAILGITVTFMLPRRRRLVADSPSQGDDDI